MTDTETVTDSLIDRHMDRLTDKWTDILAAQLNRQYTKMDILKKN